MHILYYIKVNVVLQSWLHIYISLNINKKNWLEFYSAVVALQY